MIITERYCVIKLVTVVLKKIYFSLIIYIIYLEYNINEIFLLKMK